MSDAINAALRAAQDEAAQTPQPQASVPAPAAAPQGGLPTAGGGAPRTLQDFMATAAMNVEAFLSVSELGIRYGKDKALHDEVYVEVELKNAKFGWVIRVNTPSGVRYLNSYDGVTEARSRQNWAAVVADAQKMDGNAYVSDLVELPAKLLHDGKRKEGPALPEGTVVGLSISHMNSKGFGAFLQETFPKFGPNTPFKVKLTAIPKVGSGQDYGVFGFEVVDDIPAALKGKKAA